MARPHATGPPQRRVTPEQATTASSAKEPSRRRPDHNDPLNGDHHVLLQRLWLHPGSRRRP